MSVWSTLFRSSAIAEALDFCFVYHREEVYRAGLGR